MEFYSVYPRQADREEQKQDTGDLDDFIFGGEEWSASER